MACSYSKFKYNEISVDGLMKSNQGRQLQLNFVYPSFNFGLIFLWQISTAQSIQCTWYVLLYSTPIEDIHYTDFHSSHLQNMWCIVYKSIRNCFFFLESCIYLLEMTLQYLLLILLYFKIKPFHTLIYAKFLCNSIYNKRKVLMDPTSALQKTCIFGCF